MRRASLGLLSICLLLTACGDKADEDDGGDGDGGDAGWDLGLDSGGTDGPDADGDGSPDDEDCDDADPTVFPGADETCNDVDDDCDGEIDEDPVDGADWYDDADEDGFGDAASGRRACAQPAGAVADGSDCDDADDAVFPGAEEICNDVDDDCDGEVDDDPADGSVFFADGDGDGFGDATTSQTACGPSDGWVDDDSDCDDADASVSPGADEICNDIDDDCDDVIDEDAVDETTWYLDDDGDGFGDADHSTAACAAPDGYVDDASDCDDGQASVNPDAGEVCNGIDDDCDDAVDEDGGAGFSDSSGRWTDWADALTGTSSSPAGLAIDEPGTLWFCAGTHYVNLDVSADASIRSMSGEADATILDGAETGPVVQAEAASVEVGIEGLTLQHGLGDDDPTTDFETAGGIACSDETGSSQLTVRDSVVRENQGGLGGGGIWALGCDLILESVVVTENDSEGTGGGVSTYDGDVTMRDVEISDNFAVGSAGGAYFAVYDSSAYIDVELEDVIVVDNQSRVLGGIGWENSDVTWTVSEGGRSAVLANSDDDWYGGVLHNVRSTFTGDALDFGEAGTSDDNDPYDVTHDLSDTQLLLGDDVRVFCDHTDCYESELAELGGDDWSSTRSYVLLNAVEADQLDGSSPTAFSWTGSRSCSIHWYVFRERRAQQQLRRDVGAAVGRRPAVR
ncbi:MAG: putative metal-binding motif-containing protein [Alphaproteobacteria bacterium]|nr:putative metal-binding motif-containing protein [Alphaproteobacteria bacterium]